MTGYLAEILNHKVKGLDPEKVSHAYAHLKTMKQDNQVRPGWSGLTWVPLVSIGHEDNPTLVLGRCN